MPSTLTKPLKADPSSTEMIKKVESLCDDVQRHMQSSISGALHIGLCLIHLYRETADNETPGGFTAAITTVSARVPKSTAYRWMNAASAVICRHQKLEDPNDLTLPAPESKEWSEIETLLTQYSKGTSLRRLLIGSSDVSDESRMDNLITRDEEGDTNATELLEEIAAGRMTLVQAVRALGGKVTKAKSRKDPVYLDIDGRTGQPTGLFPKCLVTIANTFSRWENLDESARRDVKASWKEVISKLPKDLR